jgi:hypothetical protein
MLPIGVATTYREPAFCFRSWVGKFEGILNNLNLGRSGPGDDGHDIEPRTATQLARLFEVGQRYLGYLFLLPAGNRVLGQAICVGLAGFDLYENQRVVMPCNDINFTIVITVVTPHYFIAATFKMLSGQRFTLSTKALRTIEHHPSAAGRWLLVQVAYPGP